MTTRLSRELSLLYAVQAVYGIPAERAARQLVADDERLLPDAIPTPPQWVKFEWPKSGEINLASYWREVDRERGAKWMGPHL